ncbi:MAG: hypothetical protein ACSLFQ_02110 [Thermoanaerobaculia bacterium]
MKSLHDERVVAREAAPEDGLLDLDEVNEELCVLAQIRRTSVFLDRRPHADFERERVTQRDRQWFTKVVLERRQVMLCLFDSCRDLFGMFAEFVAVHAVAHGFRRSLAEFEIVTKVIDEIMVEERHLIAIHGRPGTYLAPDKSRTRQAGIMKMPQSSE